VPPTVSQPRIRGSVCHRHGRSSEARQGMLVAQRPPRLRRLYPRRVRCAPSAPSRVGEIRRGKEAERVEEELAHPLLHSSLHCRHHRPKSRPRGGGELTSQGWERWSRRTALLDRVKARPVVGGLESTTVVAVDGEFPST
jgi:hypothetical protein